MALYSAKALQILAIQARRSHKPGGRVHQGLLALTLALSACTEETIVQQDPSAGSAAPDPAQTPADSGDSGAPEASAPKLDASSAKPDSSPPADTSASQLCVDTINQYRTTLNLPPLQRWTSDEACAGTQGLADSKSGTAHSAFGQCGEWAQNECPGWPGPDGQMITGCLQMMWNEGPGADFQAHGHYINMSSTKYTKVACGFAKAADGTVWAVQDFQ